MDDILSKIDKAVEISRNDWLLRTKELYPKIFNGKSPIRTGVYVIYNTESHHFYIGSSGCSIYGLKGRLRKHEKHLNDQSHRNKILQRSWNKYQANSFLFLPLEFCSKESCIEREQYWMDTLKPQYNICQTAGNTLGCECSQETREKISKANTGKEPWNRGITHSDETKAKLSKSHTGKILTEEHKQNISLSQRGKIPSNKGKSVSDETKRKMSESRKGKPFYGGIAVECVELSIRFKSAHQASRYIRKHTTYDKAAPSPIVLCAKGIKRTAYGFTWKMAEKEELEKN